MDNSACLQVSGASCGFSLYARRGKLSAESEAKQLILTGKNGSILMAETGSKLLAIDRRLVGTAGWIGKTVAKAAMSSIQHINPVLPKSFAWL